MVGCCSSSLSQRIGRACNGLRLLEVSSIACEKEAGATYARLRKQVQRPPHRHVFYVRAALSLGEGESACVIGVCLYSSKCWYPCSPPRKQLSMLVPAVTTTFGRVVGAPRFWRGVLDCYTPFRARPISGPRATHCRQWRAFCRREYPRKEPFPAGPRGEAGGVEHEVRGRAAGFLDGLQ